MKMKKISLNRNAFKIVQDIIRKTEEKKTEIVKLKNGATVIYGSGFEIGLDILRIRFGGLAKAYIGWNEVEDLRLPSLNIWTDQAGLAIWGSFVGANPDALELTEDMRGLLGKGYPICGGPAKALAVDRPEVYRMLDHEEEADVAIMTVQTDNMPLEKFPGDKLAEIIAKKCRVNTDNVYMLLSMNQTVAGIIQVGGCMLELGAFLPWWKHKYDIKKYKFAFGTLPIMPVHPDPYKTMGMANDAVTYGSRTIFYVETEEGEDIDELGNMVATAKVWPDYGKLYGEAFRDAGYAFFKLPIEINSISQVTLNDLRTGKVYSTGRVRFDLLRKSIEMG